MVVQTQKVKTKTKMRKWKGALALVDVFIGCTFGGCTKRFHLLTLSLVEFALAFVNLLTCSLFEFALALGHLLTCSFDFATARFHCLSPSGMHLERMWNAFGMHFECVWTACRLHLECITNAFRMHVECVWNAF